MGSKELFFYELEGRGYIFQNKKWDEAKHGFEDDMLNMAWEMWSSAKHSAKAQAVPEGFVVVSQKNLLELTIAINAVDLATHTEGKTNEVREMWQQVALKLIALGTSQEPAKAKAVPEGFVLIKESDRDREICELIDERDHLEDQAEQLKDKLQNLYVVDFGEHSNCNFPFQNAIDFDDSDLVLVKKDHLSEAVEKIELMFEEDSTLALGELLPIQQGIKALIEAQEQKG